MALINCRDCGAEISDKAEICPNCGAAQKKEAVDSVYCEDCGAELPENAKICPSCGCPLEEILAGEKPIATIEQKPQASENFNVGPVEPKKSKAKFIIIVAVAVVALVSAIIIGMNISEKNALAEYEDNLSIVVGLMYDSAVDAEEAGNLFHDVWYNCIYEKSDPETDPFTRTDGGVGAFYDDFNEALWALEEDPEYAETISSIESAMGVVQTYMKDLQNPPEELRTAYESVKELYDAYYVFTNLVVDPEGSLSSFTEEFNAADSDVASCLNDAMLYIE